MNERSKFVHKSKNMLHQSEQVNIFIFSQKIDCNFQSCKNNNILYFGAFSPSPSFVDEEIAEFMLNFAHSHNGV